MFEKLTVNRMGKDIFVPTSCFVFWSALGNLTLSSIHIYYFIVMACQPIIVIMVSSISI